MRPSTKNGVGSSEVSNSTKNYIVIGTTDQEIIDYLTKAGRPATEICKMNLQLGKRCRLSVDKQSVDFSQKSECCMPDNTSQGAYKCRSNNGNNCSTTSNLRNNFIKHVICLQLNSIETNQAEIMPSASPRPVKMPHWSMVFSQLPQRMTVLTKLRCPRNCEENLI
jgi:hypothetical protein